MRFMNFMKFCIEQKINLHFGGTLFTRNIMHIIYKIYIEYVYFDWNTTYIIL